MLIVERVVALHKVPIFAAVPGRVLASVAQRSSEMEVAPGTTFVVEGVIEDHLWVIVAGRVRIHRGELTLRESVPGDTVGELAALVPEPRSASATALEPTTLLRIDKPVLDELLSDNPGLTSAIITSLVKRLRETTPRLNAVASG